MRRVLAVLLLAVLSGEAFAGSNAGGKAWLSWDPEGSVLQLSESPTSTFPLFLHLADAPDIQSMAVDLHWSDSDSTSGFSGASAAPGTDCGWAIHADSTSAFLGDSTYEWTVSFAEGSPKTCVQFAIATDGSPPSGRTTFWLASVLTIDGQGEVDELETLEQAVIGSAPLPPESDHIPGLVVLEFGTGSLESDADILNLRGISAPETRHFLRDRGFLGAHKGFHGSHAADTIAIARDSVEVHLPDVSRWFLMKVREDTDIAAFVETLLTLPGVIRARPSYPMHLAAFPNDPQLSQQWQLGFNAGIRAPAAWDLNTGRGDVVVGVIDTGVDDGHGDMDPGDRSHVILGRDTANEDDNANDDAASIDGGGHGTSVAGTIGALTNNSNLVAGVLWNCKILPVKVFPTTPPWWCTPPFNCSGTTNDVNVGEGIYWAATHGADIISMSLGGNNNFTWGELLGGADPVASASYSAYKLGCVLLASTGNDSHEDEHQYPAGYPWVIAVGATDGDSARASSSNWGIHLDVMAPGVNNWTVDRDAGVDYFSGTSASAPVAAGVAGLILSEGRDWGLNLTNEDIKAILEKSATDIARTGPGWDIYTGNGLVNAQQALTLLNPPYNLAKGLATAGVATRTIGPHAHTFLRGDGDLPSGVYYDVEQWEVRYHLDFCSPYVGAPLTWIQSRQANGWSGSNPNAETTWGEAINATTTGCDLRTFVYYVPRDLEGRDWPTKWWPRQANQIVHSWAVLGNLPLQSVEVAGPHVDCAVSLTANNCGGAFDRTYEWRERPAGGTWSGIISTTQTYLRSLPGADMEFEATVRSGGLAVADTHLVTYRNCVVAVGADHRPRQLALAVSPNPAASGQSVFTVDVPEAQRLRIGIYDVSGRLLRQILNERVEAGPHRYEWDLRESNGSRVRSGVYFIRLSSDLGERRARVAVVR